MKKGILLILLFGILTSCDKQEAVPAEEQPAGLSIDEKITITYVNSKAPALAEIKDEYNVLGYGYDVTGEYADRAAVRGKIYDVVKLEKEHTNYLIDLRGNMGEGYSRSSKDAITFSSELSSTIESITGTNSFKGELTAFFSEKDAFSADKIYASRISRHVNRNCHFAYSGPRNPDAYFLEAFKQDIQNSSPEEIVKKYGTHMLTNIMIGSKLVISYQAEAEKELDRMQAANLGLTVAMKNAFRMGALDVENFDAKTAPGIFNHQVSFKTTGGDTSKVAITVQPGAKHPIVDLSAWQETRDKENLDFVGINSKGLVFLYELVSEPVKKAELKNYIERYLAENQVRLNQ